MDNRRLLVISHHYLTFIRDQVSILSTNFIEINVLVRLHWYYNIIQKDRLLDLSNKPSNVNVKTTPIFYMPTDSEYKKLGEKHFKIVEKQIKKNNIKFDIIHCHFIMSAGYVGARLKEKYNVPFIVTAHGYDIYDLPFRDIEWKEIIEYILNAADYIITVSESNLKCIKQLNVKTPVKVIPNGFNDKLFYPIDSKNCRNTLNLPMDKKIILTVGNLTEIKGHKYLVDAIGEVLKHRKDILCIIVGSGELKNKLKNQIIKAGLENYLFLAGGRPHNEIPIWMNACDVFVLPSLRESFGVVQIEAIACGKPVVGTYNGGSEEIITSEDYGLLVESANPDELAKQILIALNKEWNHITIRNYAKRFAWEDITKKLLTVYHGVL